MKTEIVKTQLITGLNYGLNSFEVSYCGGRKNNGTHDDSIHRATLAERRAAKTELLARISSPDSCVVCSYATKSQPARKRCYIPRSRRRRPVVVVTAVVDDIMPHPGRVLVSMTTEHHAAILPSAVADHHVLIAGAAVDRIVGESCLVLGDQIATILDRAVARVQTYQRAAKKSQK